METLKAETSSFKFLRLKFSMKYWS